MDLYVQTSADERKKSNPRLKLRENHWVDRELSVCVRQPGLKKAKNVRSLSPPSGADSTPSAAGSPRPELHSSKLREFHFMLPWSFGILAGRTQGTFAIRFLISPTSLGLPDLSAISKRCCRTDFIALAFGSYHSNSSLICRSEDINSSLLPTNRPSEIRRPGRN